MKQWHALQVRNRFERTVSSQLEGKGYEQYLPTYRSIRPWSDRLKKVDLPLFPGYVFCKFDFTQRLPLLMSPGVISVVTFGGNPCSISEQEIGAIQKVARSGLPYGPWPFLSVGQPVRVTSGPLHGMEGIFSDVKNNSRLIISVPLLQRSVSVEINPNSVQAIFKGERHGESRSLQLREAS